MYNQSKSNFTVPLNGAVSQAHEILRQTIVNAQALYTTLDVNRSTPVLAGYRGLNIKVLAALPNEAASVGDPAVALAIRKLLRKKHCNGVVITYPVNMDPIGGGDDSPSPG